MDPANEAAFTLALLSLLLLGVVFVVGTYVWLRVPGRIR